MESARSQGTARIKQRLRTWRSLFGRSATWTVVEMLALVLFSWPFINTGRQWGEQDLYHFYFISWGILILLLVCIGGCSRSGRGGEPGADKD